MSEKIWSWSKTVNLLELTHTDTISEVKFLEKICKPFKIKMRLKEGDDLSSIFFNVVSVKIMKTFWENNKEISLVTKNGG